MSPQYLSPGVYVEEVDRGARPIEGVGTAVAGFVGYAGSGPINQSTLVANWTQFVDTFGDFMEGSYLAHAVYGYFHNGGGSCYVMRLPLGPDTEEVAPQAALALPSRAQTPLDTLRIEALEPGVPGFSQKAACRTFSTAEEDRAQAFFSSPNCFCPAEVRA